MSSIRKLLEVSAEQRTVNPNRLWAGFDLKEDPDVRQRYRDDRCYVMSLTIKQQLQCCDDDKFHIVPRAEKALVHSLFGGALSLISCLESALHMGDKQSALEILGELKKEMML